LRWNAKEQGSRFAEAADEIERSRKNEQILSIMLSRALTKQVSDEIAKKILNNEPVEVEI
jgi:hypothetical protein